MCFLQDVLIVFSTFLKFAYWTNYISLLVQVYVLTVAECCN